MAEPLTAEELAEELSLDGHVEMREGHCYRCLRPWPCLRVRIRAALAAETQRAEQIHAHYRGEEKCPDKDDACWGCTLARTEDALRERRWLIAGLVATEHGEHEESCPSWFGSDECTCWMMEVFSEAEATVRALPEEEGSDPRHPRHRNA